MRFDYKATRKAKKFMGEQLTDLTGAMLEKTYNQYDKLLAEDTKDLIERENYRLLGNKKPKDHNE